MDLLDPLSPPVLIIHCSGEVFKAISCISRELLYIGSSWSFWLCSFIWRVHRSMSFKNYFNNYNFSITFYIKYSWILPGLDKCLNKMVKDEFKLRWNFFIENFDIFLSKKKKSCWERKLPYDSFFFFFISFTPIKHLRCIIIQSFLLVRVQQS